MHLHVPQGKMHKKLYSTKVYLIIALSAILVLDRFKQFTELVIISVQVNQSENKQVTKEDFKFK